MNFILWIIFGTENQKKIIITIAPKSEHLGMDFTKCIQDLYAENKKILIKEIKECYVILMDWEN